MQKLFIRAVLSLVLSASLISAVNLFSPNEPKPKKQFVEAPLYLNPVVKSFWLTIKYWFVGSGGTGKSAAPKPN